MLGSLTNIDASLFDQFRHLEREMDRMFGDGPWPNGIRAVARGTYPPINVGSSPDHVDLYLFAAGVDPKSLNISIRQNLLTVDGERRLATEKAADYYRKERFDGSFHRVVTLPDDVDPEKADATYVDGVLRVTVKRRESSKPRQIKVKQ